MPQIPGVPTLEPVSQPTMSPAEAGRGGEAVSQLGQTGTEVAQERLQFDLFVKRAKQNVDETTFQNQAHALVLKYQEALAKTTKASDVDDIKKQAQDDMNSLVKQWGNSPASVQIQMQADGLMPQIDHLGTVRTVDLHVKEFNVAINQQAEVLAGTYAADRGAGGSGDMALGAFSTAVAGGVQTGLVGTFEAQDMVRKFKEKGQELQIKNGISNANPDVNYKIADDIANHPEMFPDVNPENLGILKGQAMEAAERHIKEKDWMEGQQALHQQLVPKINQFTNPATGRFDVGAALTNNAKRFANGEITETQSKVLAEGFDSHYTQLQVGIKQEAAKRISAVDDLLSKHKFGEARKQMADDENWFNANDLSADHMNEMHYMNQMETQVRSEAAGYRAENRAKWQFDQEKKQLDSSQLAGKIQLELASGKVYEPSDIKTMEGLTDHDKSELISGIKDAQGFSNNPYVKDGMNKISELGILDSRKYELARVFVNQVKSGDVRGSAITTVADTLVKQAKTQHSQEWIDQLYRQTTEERRPNSTIDRFMHPMSGTNTPSRPANVPDGWTYNATGPKGAGWYAPAKH